MTTETKQTAVELADDLGSIDIKTTEDGTVLARVTDIYSRRPESDKIHIEAELPNGETIKETMEKPTTWDTRHKFVRLVEDHGYDATSIDHLVGDQLEAVHHDDDWTFADPTHVDDWDPFTKAKLQLAALTGWGFAVYLASPPGNIAVAAVAVTIAIAVLRL